MARYIEASCKLCRREKNRLFLKGDRCYTDRCAIERRSYAPGQHGQRSSKLSDYALRLREKQKMRKIYGILEAQFARYFNLAEKQKGHTGENLIKILERRLDNIVYRLGLASSRNMARQLVTHGHILVNNKKVSIPSYLAKIGDAVTVKEKSKELKAVKKSVEKAKEREGFPVWLEMNFDALTGKINRLPEREEVGLPVEPQLVVEYYSR